MKKLKRVLLSVPCFLCTLVILFSTLCFPVSAATVSNYQTEIFSNSVPLEESLSQSMMDFREYVCNQFGDMSQYLIYTAPNYPDGLYRFIFFNGTVTRKVDRNGEYIQRYIVSSESCFWYNGVTIKKLEASTGYYYYFSLGSGGSNSSGNLDLNLDNDLDALYCSFDFNSLDLKKNSLMVQDLLQRMIKEANNQLQQQTFPAVGVIVMIAVGCLALVVIFLLLLPKVLKKFGIR